jgi:anti-anti-sigma regulatory factor
VRIVADLTGLLCRPGGPALVLECERHIDRVVGPSTSAIAVCQLDRRACGPAELAALGEAHAVTVTADPDFEDSVLRIDRTFHPAGLALGGELDASRHAVFGQALAAVLARADGDPVHLDLAELEFIDLGALSMLAGAATRRPGSGPLVLDRMPDRLRSVVEVIGWDMLPGLRLGDPHPDR